MRSEARSQGAGSVSLESARGVGGKRPRKRRRLGRHTEEEEGRDYVSADAAARTNSGIRWFGTRAHTSQARKVSETEDEGRHGSGNTPRATITPAPVLPSEVRAKTVPHNAAEGEARPTEKRGQAQLAEGRVKGVCGAPPECPSLRELRKKHGLETLKSGELFFSAQLASFLRELFRLESPSGPTPDEPELRPARSANKHRSPTALDTTYSPSAAAKRIGVCTARALESVSAKLTYQENNLLQCSAG
ncbi:hypothetical protein ERJ75_001200800 [Trypanosoma vivax]|nr:hypothetical protein ERJ75_001200800 [Trypanosoma vivax]